MKILRIILMLLLFINTDIYGQNFNIEQFNFPYKHAIHSAQSDDGFIWLAHHYGLIRFDGSNYRFFRHNPQDSSSITSGLIAKIFCKDSILWLCSYTGGVSAFNLNTYKSVTWRSNPKDDSSLSSNYARGIYPENDTSVWVSSKSFCLNHLNPKTGSVKRYYPKIPSSNFDRQNDVGILTGPTVDPNNIQYLWIGSKFGFYRFDTKEKTFKLFAPKNINPSTVVTLMKPFIDSNGIVWSSWDTGQLPGKGLTKYDPISKEWHTYKYTGMTKESVLSNRLNQIHEVNDSTMLIGARAENLWLFNSKSGKISLLASQFQKKGYGVRDVYSILDDNNEDIWLVANNDLFKLQTQNNDFKYHSISYQINPSKTRGWTNCFAEDKDINRIYVGTRNGEGVVVLDENFKVLGQYFNEDHLKITSINDILVLANHDVLVATDQGLLKYDHILEQTIKLNIFGKGLQSIGRLERDSNGSIWMSVNGDELVLINLEEPTKKLITKSISNVRYSDIQINDLVIQDSIIWLGCNSGLIKYNITSDSFNFEERLNGAFIYDLELNNGELYIGTSTYGMVVYNSNKKSSSDWTELTQQDGISGQEIFNILSLEDGSLWLGSEPGFTQYQPNKNRFIQYHTENGIGFNKQNGPLIQLANGRVLSSAAQGIFYFNPEEINNDKHKPVAYIEEIKLPGKEGFRPPSSLILEPGEGSMSIIFGAIDYCTRIETRFEYLLDNYETAWNKKMSTDAIVYNKIPHGKYTFKLVAINSKGVRSEVLELPITIKTPFVKTIWFWVFLLAGLVTIFLIIYNVRLNQIRREEKIKTDFNRKIATLEMETLRSQMNPHFLFNSLNSINRFIIKKDPKLASDYLTKFARLIRMILNNSKQECITLQEEINTLKLYIEMEKLRFDGKFDFDINLLSEVDPENLFVPSMIVQPYIENAIWHGLMHKKEDRHLTIDVVVGQSHILFEIADNGIGRKRAQELKSKSSTHKSFGMKITKSRINLINSKKESRASVHIEDLFDINNNALGTKVKLNLPIIKTQKDDGTD